MSIGDYCTRCARWFSPTLAAVARGATTDFAEAEEQPSLEFSKIKLSYRVQAKFVLE